MRYNSETLYQQGGYPTPLCPAESLFFKNEQKIEQNKAGPDLQKDHPHCLHRIFVEDPR